MTPGHDDDNILAWLRTIRVASPASPIVETAGPDGAPCSKKRKAAHPPSPPSSSSSRRLIAARLQPVAMSSETPTRTGTKRPRNVASPQDDDDGLEDTTPTPRPLMGFAQRSETPSMPPSDTRSESTTTSAQSGTSSPTKALSSLELGAWSVETSVLHPRAHGMPSGLKTMLQDMDTIVRCAAFVPVYLKHALSQLEKDDPYYEAPADHMYEDDDAVVPDPARGCHTPEAFVHHLRSIVELSGECQDSFQVESGWNLLVHTPVLAAGLYLGPLRRDPVCLVPCTHAKVMRYYLPTAGAAKMVDYTISIDPSFDPDPRVMPALDSLRQKLPSRTVNHTDYDALRKRPLAVSIETKRRGESQSKSELQTGIWHAAQWRFLASQVGDRLHTLDFIPGLIVMGDVWKFVASSHKDGKTTLYLDRTIGSTTTEQGTLQILAAIRRLRRWTEAEYWPWYKREVLRLAEDGGDSAQPICIGTT